MARPTSAAKARTLRALPTRAVREAPVLTLEESVALYRRLLDQAEQLDASTRELRDQILRTLADLDTSEVRVNGLEVIRQVRHRVPALIADKAESILRRFDRLQECLVPKLDEQKATQVLEELRAQGKISAAQMPFEYKPETEALIVRRID